MSTATVINTMFSLGKFIENTDICRRVLTSMHGGILHDIHKEKVAHENKSLHNLCIENRKEFSFIAQILNNIVSVYVLIP